MYGCGHMVSLMSFVRTLVILRFKIPSQGVMIMSLSHIDQKTITLIIESTSSGIIPLERPIPCGIKKR